MRGRALSALAAALLALTAGTAAAQEQPRRGGTLIYSVTGEPETYDCHASVSVAVMHRVAPHYSLLLQVDPNDYPRLKPDLARAWTVSDDRLTYRFTLRDDVRFHDGTSLTSADVAASFERIRNPPEGVVSARRAALADVQAIETPDALTVVFRLARPNAAFLLILANPWNCIYSAQRLAADPRFPARNIIGTGPFRFVEHAAGSHWVGQRYDGYFEAGRPYLDGFRAVNVAGPALVNAIAGGQTLIDFRGLAPAERDRVRATRGERTRFLEGPQSAAILLTFNTRRAPFDDARVRRALSIALDRWTGAEMVGRLTLFGYVGGFLPPGQTGSRSADELAALPGFERDMTRARAEARRLLAEAGVTNLAFTFKNRPIYSPLGVFLLDQWRQIGVTVTHEQPENAAFFAARRDGNFDVVVDAMSEFVDEPAVLWGQFLSRDRAPANISGAIDRTLDGLYDRLVGSFDPAGRAALARDFEARLLTEAYTVPVFWVRRIIPVAAELQGFVLTPSYLIGQNLADLWLRN